MSVAVQQQEEEEAKGEERIKMVMQKLDLW